MRSPPTWSRLAATQASALGSISMNLSRAVGPAIAGFLIPRMGPASVFAADGVAVVMFVAVMLRLRPTRRPATRRPERFAAGLRAGGRYVRHAPVVQRIMLHALLFLLPASALWALLPMLASRQLHLSVGGYGILLAALGVGAVLGALIQPRLRAALCGRRIAWRPASRMCAPSSCSRACSSRSRSRRRWSRLASPGWSRSPMSTPRSRMCCRLGYGPEDSPFTRSSFSVARASALSPGASAAARSVPGGRSWRLPAASRPRSGWRGAGRCTTRPP